MTPVKQTVSDVDFLMKFWDYDNNELDPQSISARADVPAKWSCPKCGYRWEAHIQGQFRAGDKCPCCDSHNAFVPGITDFFTLVPLARESFMYEKNEGINPLQHGISSKQKVWWKCPYCGNEYYKSFFSRVDRTEDGYKFRRCVKCKHDNQKPENPISADERFFKYWNADKNRIKPENISIFSDRYVHWKCQNCGHEWVSAPKNMLRSGPNCPCCVTNKVIKAGINDVAHFFPEIRDVFDQSLNPDVRLEEQGLASTAPITFSCKNCGHTWESKIRNRIRKDKNGSLRLLGCPNCNNRSKKRMNRLVTYSEQYPELAELFADELNERTLDSINSYESKDLLLKWRCKTCGEVFDSRVSAMIDSLKSSTKGCPYCSKSKLREGESFADLHPELLDEYDPQNKLNPRMVFPGCKTRVNWICAKDNSHTWEASFSERHRGGSNCPICNRITLIKGENTFADVYPDLVQYWSSRNERTPDDIFFNSTIWYWWTCPDCGGEYGAFIKDRVSDDFKCPYCDNRRVLPGINSLSAIHPNIALMWSENNERDADHVLPDISMMSKWICPTCGGEYNARVKDVVSQNADCPYCNNRLLKAGVNSFADLHPDLLKEWDYLNNCALCKPTEVSDKAERTVWWICPNDTSHHYPMFISQRVEMAYRGREACPYCRGHRIKKRHFC